MGRIKRNTEVEPITVKEKYQKYINQAKDGYLVGFDYKMAMEVLRYCENAKGIQMGLNMSCPSCLINLLKMLDSIN